MNIYEKLGIEEGPVTLDRVSFESNILRLSTASTTSFNLVREKFPRFTTTVSSFYQELVKRPLVATNTVKADDIYKKLSQSGIRYSDMGRFTVFTPPGMSVPYVAWLKELLNIKSELTNICSQTLNPFNTWLGELVSDRTRFNSRSTNANFQAIKIPDVSKLKKDLNKILDQRETTTMPYNKALRNHSDWLEIVKLSEDNVDIMLTNDTVPKIHEQLKTSIELMDALTRAFEDLDTLEKFEEAHGKLFNGGVVKQLSVTSYRIAELIEFYSVIVYYGEATTQAINDSIAKMRKMLKR